MCEISTLRTVHFKSALKDLTIARSLSLRRYYKRNSSNLNRKKRQNKCSRNFSLFFRNTNKATMNVGNERFSFRRKKGLFSFFFCDRQAK